MATTHQELAKAAVKAQSDAIDAAKASGLAEAKACVASEQAKADKAYAIFKARADVETACQTLKRARATGEQAAELAWADATDVLSNAWKEYQSSIGATTYGEAYAAYAAYEANRTERNIP